MSDTPLYPDGRDLSCYCTAVQALQTTRGVVVTFSRGDRYARIILNYGTGLHRSVHSFVDLETGDILKADGWERPAKGARGNIFRLDDGGFNKYGVDYRR